MHQQASKNLKKKIVGKDHITHLILVLLNPNMPCLYRQSRSRSAGSALFVIQYFASTTLIKWSDWLKIRSELGILICSAWQRLRENRNYHVLCFLTTPSDVFGPHGCHWHASNRPPCKCQLHPCLNNILQEKVVPSLHYLNNFLLVTEVVSSLL